MRRGLVIGAGGVPGLAWSCGTLAALEGSTGWDPRTADRLVGTSQGSVLAAILGSGVGTDDLTRWYRRELPDTHPLRARAARRTVGSPPRRFPVPASPLLLTRALGRDRIGPLVALSGLLPAGTGSLEGFIAPVAALVGDEDWVEQPALSVVAVDYDTGRRVVWGEPTPERPPLLDAVRASCTVPGSFPPARIAGRRYVDGAVHSTTNADLLAESDLDEVVVLAPMAGEGGGWLQRFAHRQLVTEVARLRRQGVPVQVLTPSASERAVMTAHPEDPAQRFAIFEAALTRGQKTPIC